jgi:hypothetical protein
MPLVPSVGPVALGYFWIVRVPLVIEKIADRGMECSKFLRGLYVSKLRHSPVPTSERLVGVFRPVVKASTTFLALAVANNTHRSTVCTKSARNGGIMARFCCA